MPSTRLVGRAREIERIEAVLARMREERTPRLLVVSGAPGVGKSFLVERLLRDERLAPVLHAKGRPELGDTPFGAVRVAAQPHALASRADVLALLRERIDGGDERIPVLVLDDLQWLDVGTVHAVSELVATLGARPLLVVATRRESAAHPFPRLRHVPREMLDLAPLELEDIEAIVAESLGADPIASGGLARIVHQRTGGNPLFAGQLLVALAEEGTLAYDAMGGAWRWDDARLRTTEYAASVVELVGARLDRLAPAARAALELLACLGSSVDARTLAAAHDGPLDELHAVLWTAATTTNIVHRSPEGYTFLHDRVREAAYARIPVAEREARHLALGLRLLKRRGPAEPFVALEQLNRALALVRTGPHRELVSRLNLEAFALARAARDWSSARSYARSACELAEDDAFELELLCTEMDLRLGTSDPVRRARLLGLASDRLRALRVHGLFATLGSLAEPHARSVADFRGALARFDVTLVDAPPAIDPQALAHAPAADAEATALIELLAGALPMLRIGAPELYPRVLWTALARSQADGFTPALPYLLGSHAMQEEPVRALALVDLAIELDAGRGEGRHRDGLLYFRTCRIEPARHGRPPSREALEEVAATCLAAGDVRHLGWVTLEGAWHALLREPRLDEANRLADRYIGVTSSVCAAAATVRVVQAGLARLLGRAETVPRDAVDIVKASGHRPGLAVIALWELLEARLAGRDVDLATVDAAALAGTPCARTLDLLRRLSGAERAVFDEAVREARAGGAVFHEAIVAELAARAFGGAEYLRAAVDAYRSWGAAAKARLLEAELLAPHDIASVVAIARLAAEDGTVADVVRAIVRVAREHLGASGAAVHLRGDSGARPLVRNGVLLGGLALEGVAAGALTDLFVDHAAAVLGGALDREALRTERAERARLDEELRRSRALLEVAESLSGTGTFVWMPASSHYLHWSKEMRRIGGFDATPTLGETFERTHPEDRAAVSAALEAGSLHGTDLAFEHRFLFPDGAVRHVQTRARKLSSGAEPEYVGVSVDVTERKHAEEALLRTRDELSHANRVSTVGELASSIAHKINQPLAAMIADASAATHWLAAATPNLDAARESLASIERDGMRVSEILDRIRALLSRRPVAMAACDLGVLVDGVVDLVRPELARSRVKITAERDGAPVVEGDAVQLQQVLINLVMNARDASRDLPAERRRITLRTAMVEGVARVSVTDAGAGLADAGRVFEPFFTTKPNGLGMGLAISRSIVERHGGKLRAEPNPGYGTTFHVELPL